MAARQNDVYYDYNSADGQLDVRASSHTLLLSGRSLILFYSLKSPAPALSSTLRLIGLMLLGLATLPAHAQSPAYMFQDLGTLDTFIFPHSDGFAVNAAGQVAGVSGSYTAPGTVEHAFLSSPNGGALHDLGTLGGSNSIGIAVNEKGQVAGNSDTSIMFFTHAFLSDPNGGPLHDLGTFGGPTSYGYGVNTVGQVAGVASLVGGISHAFLSEPDGGLIHDLGTLGGSNSVARAVNTTGQVAGYADLAAGAYSSAHHAFLSGANGGTLNDLGTLGGRSSSGNSVNNNGQVVGTSDLADGSTHAFLSDPHGGALHDLGTLGSYQSYGFAVNDSGQAVGVSYAANSSVPRAFVFTGGRMIDLNTLVLPGSGFTLEEATGISNTGFITGFGLASGGQEHAFLLVPVPEASTSICFGFLLILGLGHIAISAKRPGT